MSPSDEPLVELENARLLTRLDAKPKGNLTAACEKLKAEIGHSTNWLNPNNPTDVTSAFNLCALLQFHCGELDRAEAVCHRAIKNCQTLADYEPHPRWAAQMIQPYINLGRIAATRGYASASLQVFTDVFRLFHEGCDLFIDGFLLSASMLDELEREEPTIRLVSRNVYVLDSLRALLLANDYEALMEFADRASQQVPDQQLALMEARVRALTGMAKYADALTLAKQLFRQMANEQVVSPVLYALIADIYRRCAMPGDAKKLLDHAKHNLEKLASKVANKTAVVHSWYRIGLMQYLIDDLENAYAVAKIALEMAEQLTDEASVIKALILLLKVGVRIEGGEPERWFSKLAAASDASHYRVENAVACQQLAESADYIAADPATAGSVKLGYLVKSLAAWKALGTKTASLKAKEVEDQISALGVAPYSVDSRLPEVDQVLHNQSVDELYRFLMGFNPLNSYRVDDRATVEV